MTTKGRFVSVNQLMKALDVPHECYVNIYFNDWIRNQIYSHSWNIVPIGFKLIKDGKVNEIKINDVKKLFPDMEFISVKESKTRRFSTLSYQKHLCKLCVSAKPKTWNDLEYYDSMMYEINKPDMEKEMLKKVAEARMERIEALPVNTSEEEDMYIDLD